MGFTTKYTREAEKSKIENKDKVVLPDADFALVEAIYALCNKLEELKLQ